MFQLRKKKDSGIYNVFTEEELNKAIREVLNENYPVTQNMSKRELAYFDEAVKKEFMNFVDTKYKQS